MNENPFIFGKPVKEEDFYNRKDEIEEAIGFLKKLQCFSIVGERRIGKTSFLQHILSKEVMEKYGIDPEGYIIVHFNMGSLFEITEDILIGAIVKRIREQTKIKIEAGSASENLEAYVEKLASDGKNLVIALDEFEIIAPILDDHFSYWLRFILQKSHVMAVIASQKTVRELGAGESASPLFNIFSNLFLSLFSREDTGDMIKKIFQKGSMKLEEDEISFLANLSGGHPYFIQLIGYHYYEERKRVPAQDINRMRFINRMMWQTRDQFDSYWKHLEDEERDFLIALTTSKTLKKSDHLACTILERKRFIIEENNRNKIFSLLFREYIIRKNPKGDVKVSKIEKETLKFIGRFKTGLQAVTYALLGLLGAVLVVVISDIVITLLREETQNYSEILRIFSIDTIYLIAAIVAIFSISFFVLSFLVLRRFEKRIKSWREINENRKEQ